MMKKFSVLITVFVSLLVGTSIKAQSNADFYAGKWKVTILGTPNGDATMVFIFEKKDTTLSGVVRDSTDKEISKIDKIEESGKTITAYFTASGYDVNLVLEPVDADNVKGSLMGMFDAKGIRVKEGGK
jgi:hypothetical protein